MKQRRSVLAAVMPSLLSANGPIIFAMAACLLALAAAAVADQAPPSADAYVSKAGAGGGPQAAFTFANTNFGSAAALLVGPNGGSYLRFNLSGIPAGASIEGSDGTDAVAVP